MNVKLIRDKFDNVAFVESGGERMKGCACAMSGLSQVAKEVAKEVRLKYTVCRWPLTRRSQR